MQTTSRRVPARMSLSTTRNRANRSHDDSSRLLNNNDDNNNDAAHVEEAIMDSSTTSSSSLRRSGRTDHTNAKPEYNMRYHPMDTVMRPKRASRVVEAPAAVSSSDEYEDDDRSETIENDDDSDISITEISTADFGLKAPAVDEKAIRRSERAEARKPVLYNTKHHPMDAILPRNRKRAKKNINNDSEIGYKSSGNSKHTAAKLSKHRQTPRNNQDRIVNYDPDRLSVASSNTVSDFDAATTLLNSSAHAAALSSEDKDEEMDTTELHKFREFGDMVSGLHPSSHGLADGLFKDEFTDAAIRDAQHFMRSSHNSSGLTTLRDLELRATLNESHDAMDIDQDFAHESEYGDTFMTPFSSHEQQSLLDHNRDFVGYKSNFTAINKENLRPSA